VLNEGFALLAGMAWMISAQLERRGKDVHTRSPSFPYGTEQLNLMIAGSLERNASGRRRRRAIGGQQIRFIFMQAYIIICTMNFSVSKITQFAK